VDTFLLRLRDAEAGEFTATGMRNVAKHLRMCFPELVDIFVSRMYFREYVEHYSGGMVFHPGARVDVIFAIASVAYPEGEQFERLTSVLSAGVRDSALSYIYDFVYDLCGFLCMIQGRLQAKGEPVDKVPADLLVFLYRASARRSDVADLVSKTDPAIVAEALETIETTDREMSKIEKWSRRKILKAMKKRAADAAE
jgi:hypothetical protein